MGVIRIAGVSEVKVGEEERVKLFKYDADRWNSHILTTKINVKKERNTMIWVFYRTST